MSEEQQQEVAERAEEAMQLLDPIHPGEILLKEFMEPLGLSMNEVGRRLGVPANRFCDIIRGRRSITADTALRLGRFFSVSPELWMGLQKDYDLRVARRQLADDLEKIIPIKEEG